MNVALVLAAGRGSRMGAERPKQFLSAGGKPVLAHTLELFQKHPEIDRIVVVCGENHIKKVLELAGRHAFTKLTDVIKGGETRRESSARGVEFLRAAGLPEDTVVLIHDGARPCVSAEVISENIRLAAEQGACVTAMPVTDTVLEISGGKYVENVPDRRNLWAAQTPQSFRLGVIHAAHKHYEELLAAAEAGGEAAPEITDDSGLALLSGAKVALCRAGSDNFKLTDRKDLEYFRTLLRRRHGQ